MFEHRNYVADETEFEQYRLELKQVGCPHCRQVGALNLHGAMRGYGLKPDEQVQRGYRIYCSNRGRRSGCGRTHSVLFGLFLRRHCVTALEVSHFLDGMLRGLSLSAAWLAGMRRFCVETARGLWTKFSRAHLAIRSRIFRGGCFPASTQRDPRCQTWEHLRSLFVFSDNLIGTYQLCFQRGFFSSC